MYGRHVCEREREIREKKGYSLFSMREREMERDRVKTLLINNAKVE